jgi:repressor LexA
MNTTTKPTPDQTGFVDLETIFDGSKPYVLRVRGDSMIGDHMVDGDYVVVERNVTPKHEDHAVVLLTNGENRLRRVLFDGDTVTLRAANPDWPDIVTTRDQCRFQGVVIGVLRSYHS